MKRKTVFAIIGGCLFAIMVIGFVLNAWIQIQAGNLGYVSRKSHSITYIGALATLGLAALAGIIGLSYRAKQHLQKGSAPRSRGLDRK